MTRIGVNDDTGKTRGYRTWTENLTENDGAAVGITSGTPSVLAFFLTKNTGARATAA